MCMCVCCALAASVCVGVCVYVPYVSLWSPSTQVILTPPSLPLSLPPVSAR